MTTPAEPPQFGALPDVVNVPGPWVHRRVAANGAQFHVAECAPAGGGVQPVASLRAAMNRPIVLFLHGFPEFWWAWRGFLAETASLGYRAVAMDLRGYGGSDKTPRGYDPFSISHDIEGVIRALGARSAVIVGHGWGAWGAWATARMQPDAVRAIATVGMAHPVTMRHATTSPRQIAAARRILQFQLPLLPERNLVADDCAEVERILRDGAAAGSTFPPADVAARYRAALSIWPAPHCALEYHRWAVRSLRRSDGRRFYRLMEQPISQPVLAIRGTADRTLLATTGSGDRRYTTGEYISHEMPNVGHFPHEEAPDEVRRVLFDWLRTVAA